MNTFIKENWFRIVLVVVVVILVSLVSKFLMQSNMFSPTIEPEQGNPSTEGYIYDDILGYGFEYPNNSWEVIVNISKNVAQCDPLLNYEDYTCVDFPYENIKKVINFTKKTDRILELPAVQVNFTVRLATDLSEVNDEFKKEVVASNMPILSESAIKVNDINGYDTLAGTSEWKLRQVVFFANGMAYIFRYSSQEELYRLNEETFNSIISSFNTKNTNNPATNDAVNNQIANPASVNCVEKGGKLSIVDNPEGQVGMCTLSDGTVCEEWAYLRGECQKK